MLIMWLFGPVVTSTHPGLVPRRSMEVTSEAWSLLEEHEPPVGTQRVEDGAPGCELPAARLWCVCRDLGRLAKRPSAIIFNSGKQTVILVVLKSPSSTRELWRFHYKNIIIFSIDLSRLSSQALNGFPQFWCQITKDLKLLVENL